MHDTIFVGMDVHKATISIAVADGAGLCGLCRHGRRHSAGWVEETDVDGFNLSYAVTHETFEDIVNLLVPELQRRGVYPNAYGPGSALREKLFSAGPYLPANHPSAQYRGMEAFRRKQADRDAAARGESTSFGKSQHEFCGQLMPTRRRIQERPNRARDDGIVRRLRRDIRRSRRAFPAYFSPHPGRRDTEGA